jgi:calcineurin-like phosphoesterase family protein
MKKTPRFSARIVGYVSVLLAAAATCGPARPADAEDTGAGRVVAIGDVHGAFPEFVGILQRTGLINDKLQWSGGSAVFVQTGDVPDRGPATRPALDLLMRLESEAPKQNGKVIPLLGNHEVMNMIGDTRYVSVEDYRSFATDQSDKRQEQEWEDYKKFVSQHGHPGPLDDQARAQWMAAHPIGFFERRDAFAPDGVYGRWLRQHDAVAEIDEALFMHGGLDPKLHFRNIDDLNRHIHSELESFDTTWKSLCGKKILWPYMTLSEAFRQAKTEWEQSGGNSSSASGDLQKFLSLPSGLLMAENSPFWYRGLALEPEGKLDKDLDKMLGRLKVHYLVAAHTVRPKFDITSRFDNRVFLIDTGMLKSYFGGRASALEFKEGRVTAYYADAAPQVLVGHGAATSTPGGGAGDSPRPQ